MRIVKAILTFNFILAVLSVQAQELQVKVNINHSQISGTDVSVFENLQQTLEQFVNERQWTELQFQKNERIQCSFNITVSKYIREENRFECSALIQANRPVYNSAYTSTLYNNKDDNFHFEFKQFDQLNFVEEVVSDQLTRTGSRQLLADGWHRCSAKMYVSREQCPESGVPWMEVVRGQP